MSSCRLQRNNDAREWSDSTLDRDERRVDSLIDLFDQAKKKSSRQKPTKFQERQARQSLSCARVAELAETKERALKYLNKAIDYYPSPALYAKRCLIHLHLGNNLLAASDAICAIGMDPTFPSGYWCAAAASIRNEAYCDALKYMMKLRDLLPNSKKCNDLYVQSRTAFWREEKIPPMDLPESIAWLPIDETPSVFTGSKISELNFELSSTGVLEASKLNEKFVKKVIETYKRGLFHLPQKYVFVLLKNTLDLLKEQPNIVSVDISKRQKLTVVGDLQGNFHNLMSIFRHNHSPQFGRPYIFNGNVIGRDKMSLPCMVILLCLKLLYPEDVHIARGSEECLEMCALNGFENEVVTVYDEETMKGFTEVFNWLPIAHVVNNSVLVLPGGLFQDDSLTLADVQELERCRQPPDVGLLCDILHSDPWNERGTLLREHQKGIWFGPDVTEKFCHLNCIDYIITSHLTVGPLGVETQDGRRCVTLNSSAHFATYIVMKGKMTYKVVHSRRDKVIPKHCRCFLVCKCSSHHDNKEQQQQPNYVTLDLTLPHAPSELAAESSTSVQKRSSVNSEVMISIPSVSSKITQLGSRSKSTSTQALGKVKTESTVDPAKTKDTKKKSLTPDGSLAALSSESLKAKSSAQSDSPGRLATALSVLSHQPFSPLSSSRQSYGASTSRTSDSVQPSARGILPGDAGGAPIPIGDPLERLRYLQMEEDAMTEAATEVSLLEEAEAELEKESILKPINESIRLVHSDRSGNDDLSKQSSTTPEGDTGDESHD